MINLPSVMELEACRIHEDHQLWLSITHDYIGNKSYFCNYFHWYRECAVARSLAYMHNKLQIQTVTAEDSSKNSAQFFIIKIPTDYICFTNDN